MAATAESVAWIPITQLICQTRPHFLPPSTPRPPPTPAERHTVVTLPETAIRVVPHTDGSSPRRLGGLQTPSFLLISASRALA